MIDRLLHLRIQLQNYATSVSSELCAHCVCVYVQRANGLAKKSPAAAEERLYCLLHTYVVVTHAAL